MTIIEDTRRADRMRQVNDAMWESLAGGGYTEPIAFFCECADADCYQAVWLTSDEYAEARTDPGWVAVQSEHHPALLQVDGLR